jgi:hypothetical protein
VGALLWQIIHFTDCIFVKFNSKDILLRQLFWNGNMKTLQHLSEFFYRLSTGWATLISLLVFIAFMILVLPVQADLAQQTSNGAASPDSSFFYSPDDLYAMADTYGETGRAAYVRARWTFDVSWPPS